MDWQSRCLERRSWFGAPARAALLRRVRAGALAVAFLGGLAQSAAAQGEGTVAGVVVAEGSAAPLADAQVGVEGTSLGAITDAEGQFRVTGLSGAEVRLTIRRIGFRPETRTVRVGDMNVRVTLAARALELDQVVVTGTAGATEQRAVGNAVSQIRAADIVQTQPIQDFQQLLNGRATGVAVIPGSGQVGTGSRIRVRGASSLSLSNEPLIYVDGVRVDNTQASGPTTQGFSSRSISRWNDFNPEDIESIEIIKGPAAATLYGTEAANGVVQIITKKGTTGRPAWNVTMRGGANWFNDPEGRLWTNYGTRPTGDTLPNGDPILDTTTVDIVDLEKERGRDIWRTGQLTELNLNVSGGTPLLRYYAGVAGERNEGADPDNRLNRYNGRLNLSLTPSDKWDLAVSAGYTTGRTYLPFESGGGGLTWTTYFAQPQSLDTPRRGFYSGPPEAYVQGFDAYQDVNRFTGSLSFNHRPAAWFSHRLVFGTDVLGEDNQEIGQRNDALAQFFSELGSPGFGYMDVSTRNVSYNTLDYGATATAPIGRDLVSTTSVGAQYYGRTTRARGVYGEGFPASGFKSLQSLNMIQLNGDSTIENTTVGVYVQEQIGWKNRLFLTGALRADDNSSFGENFDLVYYPKVSASWVVSEEPFFNVPLVSTLKLRGAYGQSGQQPEALTALRSYESGGSFSVTPQAFGNPDLGPERSDEMEVGADLSMFDDRLGVEFTYFRGTTRDAILTRNVPPSLGFPGIQYFNAGRVDRQGLEVLLRGTPVQRENVALDLALSVGTNTNEIKSLGNTDFISLASYVGHRVGYPAGSFFDRRIVSAELDADGDATNLQCDDGQGGAVPCASAPRVYLGNSIPKTEGSFTSGLTLWKNLRLNALIDFKTGFKKIDANYRVRCHLFRECRQNYFPAEFDPVTVAYAQAGGSYFAEVIDDASFARFRELSATYAIPTQFLGPTGVGRASVTVAARNLHTWSDYMGLEPEASFLGGTRGGYGQFEQNVLPQLRSFVVTLNLGF